MAINPATLYPGKTAAPDQAYPLGAARNVTISGDGTGTPLDAAWVSDLWGFFQAVLAAGGIAASGTPDTAISSQYQHSMLNAHGATFLTATAMAAASHLKVGNFVVTQGRNTINDGLGGFFSIVAAGTHTHDGINYIDLPNADGGNGLQAVLINLGNPGLLTVGTGQLQDGSVTADKLVGGLTIPTGLAMPYGGAVAPSGFLPCDATLYDPATYPDLFGVVGTTYGGNGTTTFGVPDLRRRSPVGLSSGGPFSDIALGDQIGAEEITLVKENLPPHQHSLYTDGSGQRINTDDDQTFANAGSWRGVTHDGTNDGLDNLPFNIESPGLGMNWIIKT